MIHCPNCEVPLSTADLRAGNCPVCRTIITPALDTIPASPANRTAAPLVDAGTSPSDNAAQAMTDEHATLPVTPEPYTNEPTPALPPRPRRRFALLAVGAAGAVVLVLVATLILGHATPATHSRSTAQSHAATTIPIVAGTATPAAHGGVATSPTQVSSTPVVATPGATAIPALASPTSLPAATPVPTGQANLAVSPLTFSLLACVNAQETFTITNTGTAALQWTATTHFTLNQPSGTLAAGAHSDINVSGIYKSGDITVTATDLAGAALPSSPQTVTVSCTV